MPDDQVLSPAESKALLSEVGRLKKMVKSLMDRAERNTSVQGSDFSSFQTAIMLEDQVRKRTSELQAALSENEKINRALRESEATFHGLVNQSLVGIVIIEEGRLSYVNPKFGEIFGHPPADVLGHLAIDFIAPDDQAVATALVLQQLSGEAVPAVTVLHGLHRSGAIIDIEVHTTFMELKGKRAFIGLVVDVTERMRAERDVIALQEALREQATHDALTGLFNRHYLEDSLAQALIAAERHGHPLSVIMADLDHFKRVNDVHGHLAGDQVLREFGALFKRHARGSDVYCRYGGEEFLLVMPQLSQGHAVERAEQLRSALAAAPVQYGSERIAVTASFGVSTFPQGGCTGDQLISSADKALYEAKAAGRNRVHVGHVAAV